MEEKNFCNQCSNNQVPTSSFSKKTKMKSNFTELFRTVLHFFIPECIDSCADGKPQEETNFKTPCRQNHDSVSNSQLHNKCIQTFSKETQTDTSCFNSGGLSVNWYSLINSDAQQEKCMEKRFQCFSELTSIGCFDLDQNNNNVTMNEIVESSHHPKDSFILDERCDHSSNAGTDWICEVKTGYGTTESVSVLKDNLIPFVYDLYELPVLFKDSDYIIESSNSISSKSTVENISDHIVWTTWSYPTLNWNNLLTDETESLVQRNHYNCLQNNTDSWVAHWPHLLSDGEIKFLNSTQYSNLIDYVAVENIPQYSSLIDNVAVENIPQYSSLIDNVAEENIPQYSSLIDNVAEENISQYSSLIDNVAEENIPQYSSLIDNVAEEYIPQYSSLIDNVAEEYIPQYSSLIDNVAEENFAENDIYFEDDYLQHYNPAESESVPDLIEDFQFDPFYQTSKNIEELIHSSVREMAVNVSSLRTSCRQKHYSTSDVPCPKNVTMTCCKETQTDESCFDAYPVHSMSPDPLLGLQIAFECSTMGSTFCIEDSARAPFIFTESIST